MCGHFPTRRACRGSQARLPRVLFNARNMRKLATIKMALTAHNAGTRPFSQNRTTTVMVISVSAVTSSAIVAAARRSAWMRRHFSSATRPRTARRDCEPSRASGRRASSPKRRGHCSSRSYYLRVTSTPMSSPTPNADTDALIGMIANDFVRGLRSGDRLFFQALASVLGAFHRRRESSANFVSFSLTSPALALSKSSASRATVFKSVTNLSVDALFIVFLSFGLTMGGAASRDCTWVVQLRPFIAKAPPRFFHAVPDRRRS